MEQKTRCIVLRTVKYGDNKIIADLLCREGGRVSVVLPFGSRGGGQRSNSASGTRLNRAIFQPLFIIDADIKQGRSGALSRITDANIAHVYTSLPFDGSKLSLVFFISEFLSYATRDAHHDPTLYDFIEQSLIWLDETERGIVNFHLMFMMRLSRFLGFYPDIDSYVEGSYFDLREGSFTLSVPCHRDFLSSADATNFVTLMRMSPANIHIYNIERSERNRITDLCLNFYRLHIPAFGTIKSLEVLRAL